MTGKLFGYDKLCGGLENCTDLSVFVTNMVITAEFLTTLLMFVQP